MSEFRICGVKVSIDFSFLVFLSLLFLLKNGSMIFSFFTVCLVHEIGHAVAVYMTGGRLSSLFFCGMGIKMIPERLKIFPLKSEVVVLLAGPVVNVILFIVLNSFDRGNEFALLNLCAAVFNLLPYKILDGGTVINLISENRKYEKAVGVVLNVVRIFFVVVTFYMFAFLDRQFIALFSAAVFYFISEFK